MEADKIAKTIIAEDIEITGNIKSASQIQFDGKLNGDLNCVGSAMLGKSAIVKGNIMAESVIIAGSISGNITAKDRIEMKSTAKVQGDIRAKRLTVEDGVTFIGKSEVNPAGFGEAKDSGSSSQPATPAAQPSGQAEAKKY
jgi:cytoskeletal protein CcmA (bactofilin family)